MTLAQAEEFTESIRYKQGEKQLYKDINKMTQIRFPIKVDVALVAHKVSLVIQCELGGVDQTSERFAKHKGTHSMDKAIVFKHINRLVQCFVGCVIEKGDSVAAMNIFELARSLSAKSWDHLPGQLLQLENIGPVAVRTLVQANIKTIEQFAELEPQRIEYLLTRNPPFGTTMSKVADQVPRLSVTAAIIRTVSLRPSAS
jgi:ATP-dependent DNA helicase HFM1/MER3